MERRFRLRWAPLALALGIAVLGAGKANACPGQGRSVRALGLKLLAPAGLPVNNSIVGLWQVTYTVDSAVWDMAFDTWHSDGTEFENAMDSPLISAVCQGAWEMAGPNTVKLHHVGWQYDPTGTVLLGTFTIDEMDTLTGTGYTYSGEFTFQLYDLNGNPSGAPTKGVVSAVRITAK